MSAWSVFWKRHPNPYLQEENLSEITQLIKASLAEYGEYNEELEEFVYKPEFSDLIPIVAIDDVSGITIESSVSEKSGLKPPLLLR